MRKLIRSLWILSILVPQLASALSVRTLAFDLPEQKVEIDLTLENAKEPLRIEVEVNQFGKSTPISAGNYTTSSKSFKLPGKLTLPETGSSSYLLLVFMRQGGELHILPVADEQSQFSGGDRFFINATREEIAVRIHQTKLLLSAGKSSYFKLPTSPIPGNRMEVEMYRNSNAVWKPFNSTYWPVSSDSRSIVLIYPDPNTGNPRVKSLMDRPTPPEDVAAAR